MVVQAGRDVRDVGQVECGDSEIARAHELRRVTGVDGGA
jgi:hypothetical protein